MSSIADKVRLAVASSDTFSLYAGVVLKNGVSEAIPQGSQEFETRNNKGQVSTARYRYADNSVLTYTRKPDNQYTLTVTKAKP